MIVTLVGVILIIAIFLAVGLSSLSNNEGDSFAPLPSADSSAAVSAPDGASSIIVSSQADESREESLPTESTASRQAESQANVSSQADAPAQTSPSSQATPSSQAESAGASEETVSQQNALRRAKQYLSLIPFSYHGLVEQLKFDKFSEEDAVYAAERCGADWNEEALKKAKSYLELSAFSYDGLCNQLTSFDGFTDEQAAYGADNCGADWRNRPSEKLKPIWT